MTSRHTAHYHSGSCSFASVPRNGSDCGSGCRTLGPTVSVFFWRRLRLWRGLRRRPGGGDGLAGCVCAGDWGAIAVITKSAITIAEYLIWPLLGRPPMSRCCNICLYTRPAGALLITLFTMMPRLSRRRFLNRFHTLIGSDDPPDVSVGWCPPTEHTYSLQKEAFRPSMTSPFMSNGFSIARALPVRWCGPLPG